MYIGKINFLFISFVQAFVLFQELQGSSLIDLQDMSQDFVLETKQITIPGYDGSFNPTLTRWGESLILTFRVRNPVTNDTSQTGFVLLDNDLNVISQPKLLEIIYDQPPEYCKMQDPRIVAVGNKYYIVFNNQIGMAPTKEIRRMFVAPLNFDGERLYTGNPEGLFDFYTPQTQYQEKNWVPFAYDNQLLMAYSLNPHYILQPLPGTESCASIASTVANLNWNWGDPRGGTPALLDGDQYIAFFHSSKQMATVNSKGKSITHYFMGAYTFSNEPPFALTAISPEPIVGENFYYGKSYPTWKPLLVVFPCGFVTDENYFWVSYGRQDYEIWIVKLDKNGLLNSLKPISPVQESAQ